MKLFLNGQIVGEEATALLPNDRGFTLGDGLFETIKAKNGVPLRLDAHWQRLSDGAALLRLILPFDQDRLTRSIGEVLAANALTDGVLRLTVSRGPGARGLLPPHPSHPTVMISASLLPLPPGPARVIITRSIRRDETSPLSRCKSLSYLGNVLARIEADERGGDDALLLNGYGRVAESSVANLFAVLADGAVVTPPLGEGALPGVRRQDLLRTLHAQERPLTEDDLRHAREIFLTSALSIRAVVAVDGHAVGSGHVGDLTRRLIAGMDQS